MSWNLKTVVGSTAVLMAAFACAGCSSTPTLGDMMSSHGKVADGLGDDWSRGQAMVKKGTKLKTESEKLIAKGQSKEEEAERLLAEGQQLQQATQVAFKQQFGTLQQ
ncbi:hypothetical protein Poly51_02880 [Rubripirellula tenax]|uniref:Lipoprotein n=2 Tax=Rubripirellula tenax TaxID=2528015 RepID=A0A5C6FGN4_9BACT|nr:hypothetical protein Poly51_02880 [Rubripirellula tenax]